MEDREFLMIPVSLFDDPIFMRMPFEYFGIWIHICALCVKMPELTCHYSTDEIAWIIRNDDVEAVESTIKFCLEECMFEKTEDGGLKPNFVVPS